MATFVTRKRDPREVAVDALDRALAVPVDPNARTAEGWRTCVLCGHAGMLSEVRPSVSRLRDPGPAGAYVQLVRCKRVDECRARCLANGDPWPLDDGRTPVWHEDRGR